MSLGERATLEITSDFAYGERAMGDAIPAKSDLVFDVELVKINGKKLLTQAEFDDYKYVFENVIHSHSVDLNSILNFNTNYCKLTSDKDVSEKYVQAKPFNRYVSGSALKSGQKES